MLTIAGLFFHGDPENKGGDRGNGEDVGDGMAYGRGDVVSRSAAGADRRDGRVQINQSVPATVAAIINSSIQGISRVRMAQATSGTMVRVDAYFPIGGTTCSVSQSRM